MFYQDSESLRASGNEHLNNLIAEADIERLANQIEQSGAKAEGTQNGWFNWLTGWAKPNRHVARKSA